MEEDRGHLPVLLNETLEGLTVPARSRQFADLTFGGGGHSRALLETHSENQLVAFDQDPDAIPRTEALKKDFPERFAFRHASFLALENEPSESFDGILIDLGISSFQIDEGSRGFSFRFDAPLDMRMNPSSGEPASRFLETAGHQELVEAVRNFGEEPRWRAVVNAIETSRGTGVLARTGSFADLVRSNAAPPRPGQSLDPATRTFQGVRIAVNEELSVLERVLPIAFSRLAPGGRLAVISFHSLEDRIVKRFLKRKAGFSEHSRDSTPRQFRTIEGKLITRKPIVATDEERSANPRSRSARLRIFEKGTDS